MGISIRIREIDDDEFTVNAAGSISNIITNTDRKKFGLSDNALKEAVENFKGRRPTDVYLCSPTPWGDMYSTYNIDQIRKIIKVKKAKVVEVKKFPVITKKGTFKNTHATASSTHDSFIKETISNYVSHSWTNEENLSVSQSIGFDIKALKLETSLSYSQSWGSTDTKSKIVTSESGFSCQIPLEPGQSATVELKSYRKIAKIEITYKCYLEGDVGINYHERYQGFHFHFEPIEDILEAGEIDNSVIVKELIEIEVSSDSDVIVS